MEINEAFHSFIRTEDCYPELQIDLLIELYDNVNDEPPVTEIKEEGGQGSIESD